MIWQKMWLFLVFLLVISSCSNNSDAPKLEKDLYKGTTGVVLSLFETKIPSEVFEGEEFNYIIKVENKGVYPVTNSKIVVGLEKGFMEFKEGGHIYPSSNIQLQGKDYFLNFNDFEILEVPIKVRELDALSEYHDSYLLTTFCYDYHGIAFADICIDTDPHDTKESEKPCKGEQSISLSSGQGGPVVIEKIETRMLLENSQVRPQFKIYLRNGGKGTVIKKGTVEQVCNSEGVAEQTYNTIDLVNIEFSGFSLSDFECLPEGLSLRREQEFFVCTLKPGKAISVSTPTYQTPFKVEIDYGYTESLSKQIKIQKILIY